MTSIRDVAKIAGVSPATVSRVMNGTANVNEEKRQRVEAAIEKTGFCPNELARALYKKSSKIIGVIVPGARAAVRETRNGQIGVLGTEATIKSETYTKEIRKLMPEAEVIGKPCPLFVPLVEEGFAKHKITEEVIDIYLSDMRKSEIDTLILGCTHYPLLRSRIMAYFGESVHIVNPAYETAMDLKKILEEQKIANTSGEPAAYDFYVSDAAEKFKKFANSILPYDVDKTQAIDIEDY